MKKRLSALLACLLLLSLLTACSGQSAQTASAPETETSAETSVPAEDAPETAENTVDLSANTEVVEAGMTPVTAEALAEGVYTAQAVSSSEAFRISSAKLLVDGGKILAVLTMENEDSSLLYMGSAAEAAAAGEDAAIKLVEMADGSHSFTLPIEALDESIPCAVLNAADGQWYDRTILLRADSLPASAFVPAAEEPAPEEEPSPAEEEPAPAEEEPAPAEEEPAPAEEEPAPAEEEPAPAEEEPAPAEEEPAPAEEEPAPAEEEPAPAEEEPAPAEEEPAPVEEEPAPVEEEPAPAVEDTGSGVYTIEISFSGGSGRAYIQSPVTLTISGGAMTARVVWSSSNYDYVLVGGTKYTPITLEGGSTFDIPVSALDTPITIIGDTLAMSTPHEIEYTITFLSSTMKEVG